MADEVKIPETKDKEVPEKLSDQALLMLKLREMAQISRQADTSPIFRAPTAHFNEQGKIVDDSKRVHASNFFLNDKKRRFNNLCVLDYEYPYAVPNILLSHDEDNSPMLKLSTLQLSLLMPRIRIFKTVFDLNLHEELHIELPFDDVANKDDIERMYTDGVGRGSGCGLESFEWKSLGKNQANIAQFSATLKIFLQNIEEMQQVRNSATLENGRTINVSILDLLYQKPDLRAGTNEGSNIYDQRYFGIKVQVGWRLDPNVYETFKAESRSYGDDPDKILSSVLSQNHVFFLSLNGHNLDINNDGSVSLTIDYIASAEIEAIDMIDANVLRLTKEDEYQMQAAIQRKKDIDRQMNSFKLATNKTDEAYKQMEKNSGSDYRRFLKAQQGNGTYSDYVEKHHNDRNLSEDASNLQHFQELDKAKQEADKDVENLQKKMRSDRLKSMVTNLFNSGLINTLCIPEDDIKELLALKEQIVETTSDLAGVKQILDTAKKNIKIVPSHPWDDSAIEALKNIGEQGTPDQQKLTNELGIESIDKNTNSPCPEKSKQIPFFFFGDLLNVVLELVFNDEHVGQVNNFKTKSTRILLGPITYYDFGSIEDHGLIIRTKATKNQAGETVSVYSGKQTIVNIADIPISVKEFSKWFVENVINKGKENYSFLAFAQDLVDSLIVTSISGDTFKFAPKQQARVNLLPFSCPQLDHNEKMFEDVLNNKDLIKSFRFDLNPGHNRDSNLQNTTLLPFLHPDLKNAGKKQNYILFYGVNQAPFDRVADVEKDLEQKIYHVYIGEERGLVKDIKFSRDDNPRARAVNIQQNNPAKQGDGMIVREKYSANIGMFGNFLFMPGQQIFIHPTYAGLKGRNVRENIFRNLGLGGYYRIIEVNNRILSGEFTTNVTTRWEAFGDGTLNLGDKLVGDIVGKEVLTDTRQSSESGVIDSSNKVQLVGGDE